MSSAHKDHQFAEGYSARNPVPTIQGFKAQHAQQLADAAADHAVTTADAPEVDKPLPAAPGPTANELAHTSHPAFDGQKFDPSAKPANGTSRAAPPINGQANSQANGQTDTKPDAPTQDETVHQSKDDVKAMAQANKAKPTDNLKKANRGDRTVKDPVTGQDVVVKDAEYTSSSFHDSSMTYFLYPFLFVCVEYDNAALDPANPKPGPALNPPQSDEYVLFFRVFYPLRPPFHRKTSALHTAPNPVQATNISFQPYPPEISTESLGPFTSALSQLGLAILAGCALVWVAVAFGKG